MRPEEAPKRPGPNRWKLTPITKALPEACSDEAKAVEFMEREMWLGVPKCPHCQSKDVRQMLDKATGGRSKRFLWRCLNKECRKQFTVRIGTVMEDSRIPTRHWCYAFWAACASKKGVSALQIKRQTGIGYEAALFMMHRVRAAMGDNRAALPKMTGTIEADETFVGGKPRFHSKANLGTYRNRKSAVFAMVKRGGEVRAFPVNRVNSFNLQKALLDNVDVKARIFTDDAKHYPALGPRFQGGHASVNHSAHEYVRGEVHTNTVEGFFSLFKRGMIGTFHSVSKHHLHRYADEFAFRYTTRKLEDGHRVSFAIRKARGKRLMYRDHVARQSA